MKKNIEVRLYQDNDAQYLTEIFYNTIHTINAKDYTEEQLNAWAPASSLEPTSWKNKWSKVAPFVALIDQKIVGFAQLESNGHIDCFYVHHDFQGCGVGQAIMTKIEQEANDQHCNRIFAEVSITAKPFFEGKGFYTVKQQKVRLRGVEFINFLMQKNLTLKIRTLSAADILMIVEAFNTLGWNKPTSLFEKYLTEATLGERCIWTAYLKDQFPGYITLKWNSLYEPFQEQKIPEIMDLNVLPQFRQCGIGSMLLNTAEQEARKKSDTVGLGVGLYAGADGGYGAAQRLYMKRGYIPNGLGVSYNYQPTVPGATYPLDDDFILWLTKNLK
jgi:GNAT superfamily N-acetyltransferase